MGKGKKGEQIFNEDNDAVHETMALIQKEGMKPTKEEIDAMEAGGAGRGAEPTIKAPEAAAPTPKKEEGSGASAMLMVAVLFFAADIGKNVVEANVNGGFGKRMNTSWLTFILSFSNLVLAVVLTYVRQGTEGLSKLPDLEKIGNFALPAVFFGAQASLMQLATIFLTSGSMRKVLGQMRIPLTMVFSGTIMGATFTGLQKLAVGMILCSVWMFIVVVGGGKSVLFPMDGNFMLGLLVMVLANLAAVFGTLVAEKFLKKGAKTSFYIQMFWIQVTQTAISLFMYAIFTPYILGYTFKVLLPVLGQADKANSVLQGQNPFALKSNLMLAKGGYPFGDMLKDHGNSDAMFEIVNQKYMNYMSLRKSLLEQMAIASSGFQKADAPEVQEADNETIKQIDDVVSAFWKVDDLKKAGEKLSKDDKKGKKENKDNLKAAKKELHEAKDAFTGSSFGTMAPKEKLDFLAKYTGKMEYNNGKKTEKKNRINTLLLSPKEQKAALRKAIVTTEGTGASTTLLGKSKISDAELFLAEQAGLISIASEKVDGQKIITWAIAPPQAAEMVPLTKYSLVSKVFGGLYVEAVAAQASLSKADTDFMTSYPFVRETVKQQPEDVMDNFVLSAGEYLDNSKAHFGEALHGAVFSKKDDGFFQTEIINFSKGQAGKLPAKKLESKKSMTKKDTDNVTPTKVQFQVGNMDNGELKQKDTVLYKLYFTNEDVDEDEPVTDKWTTLMKCDNEDSGKDRAAVKADAEDKFVKEDVAWTNLLEFPNYANRFMKNCHIVADLSSSQIPEIVHVVQQPGKYGAGTRNKKGDVVCDHRCDPKNFDQSDYAQFGWWINYNQKLVTDYNPADDGASVTEADQSKFAFIPGWALFTNFGLFTCNPFAGFFDTWLLWLAAIANIAATWMSALVTKVLSSLHKQIISAVCLAAINFIEFYTMWEPSRLNKIAIDNFYMGVAGVILSALLYSQAPKAPKKVEAKKD